jgi:hypothetical protein
VSPPCFPETNQPDKNRPGLIVPAATCEVAQIVAALGRQFSHELISAVATMPKQQLDDALAKLVRAELIFRRGTPVWPKLKLQQERAVIRAGNHGLGAKTVTSGESAQHIQRPPPAGPDPA